jgi:hypothetical protein
LALRPCLTGFLPQQSLWANVAPTWNDTYYRNEVLQVCLRTLCLWLLARLPVLVPTLASPDVLVCAVAGPSVG